MLEEISYVKLNKYQEAFKNFDQDDNWSISFKELGSMMKSLGQTLTDSELRKIIAEVDLE